MLKGGRKKIGDQNIEPPTSNTQCRTGRDAVGPGLVGNANFTAGAKTAEKNAREFNRKEHKADRDSEMG